MFIDDRLNVQPFPMHSNAVVTRRTSVDVRTGSAPYVDNACRTSGGRPALTFLPSALTKWTVPSACVLSVFESLLAKTKFHYAIWFEPASNQIAFLMEFGFKQVSIVGLISVYSTPAPNHCLPFFALYINRTIACRAFEALYSYIFAQGSIIRWGAHWRHLMNTTEPSMCGDDAALSNYSDHLFLLRVVCVCAQKIGSV